MGTGGGDCRADLWASCVIIGADDVSASEHQGANEFDWQHGPSKAADGENGDQDTGFEADRYQFGDRGAAQDAARNQRRLRAKDRGRQALSRKDGFGQEEYCSASDLQQDSGYGDCQADGRTKAESDFAKRAWEVVLAARAQKQ